MDKMNEMTDEQLAMSYIEGNNRAFDLLLERNQSKLFSYIMFVVRDHDKADDIFQETFVKVITKLHQGKYVCSGRFSAWLMRIAHNVIMDSYRDQRAQNIVEPTDCNDLTNLLSKELLDTNIEDRYVSAQMAQDVQLIMNLLPPSQREVVFMRYYQDMSFREIAETTGVSINTSLGRMRYALMNMRRIAHEKHIELQYT